VREPLGAATVAILKAIETGHRFGLDIMRMTGQASGTVYPTLQRAERAGLVRSRWEERRLADHDARPRRRYYQLTPAGHAALGRAIARLAALAGVDPRQRLADRKARG
jgi:DNA-binding PadR family transcriptional regulator